MDKNYWNRDGETAWCPGCGNFGIRDMVMDAYSDLNLSKDKVIMVSGVGQAAKAPQYYDVNYFNGLHGRALPAALGIHTANPEMKIIVQSGDGDIYGEGGNHFLHAIRRNPDMTLLVHDNMIYGLTKGQAAPTTQKGMVTSVQTQGVFLEPINPVAMAITMGATFVARGSISDKKGTTELIKRGIEHKGLAIIDIFQNCVSFNKQNTFAWYKNNSEAIPVSHDPSDKMKALELAMRTEPWLLGLFYQEEGSTFAEHLATRDEIHPALYQQKRSTETLNKIFDDYR
ncbi:thiamine pyrophosphate-dependent enzyme [Spirochaeta cellobiosiphila]|uniref:thiamine pyrophosphate-dependent enzyme n=1 Tax=Spirochaeta cellobiosiphila TaxID=504483 RepID=UPI0003F7A11B|nr:thiamine pyrophosphate-dependent enzyme [Spirochaeta cellobiosiphila]